DAAPGVYTGRLTLSGGGLDQALPLELQVYGFALPRETHFRNFFYYGPEQIGEFYGADATLLPALERQFQRLAHDHRVSLATEPELSGGGFDWGAWWVRYGPYLDGSAFDSGPCRGVGANLWPVGISHDASKDDFQAAARSAVEFCGGKHLLERVFLGLWDEPGSGQDYADIRRFAGWAHEAVGRRLPVMVTEQVQPEKPEWGSLLGAVDIFCSDKSSDADMALARARGAAIWVYNGGLGGGPYIDLPPLAVTVWGAAAWRWRLGGWYMWDSMYWRQKHFKVQQATDLYHDPLTFDETLRKNADGTPYRADWALRLNGDGVFFYPGKPAGCDGPVGCIRLKALRRAAQDYEYLWLLAKAGKRDLADGFAQRLSTGRNQWEPDPSNWVRVRGEMAAALKGTK
ncbi:MAG: DUF4091 domain-containing protein, partial [Armatimonadetes bacterium]|nr:DUF4091 domain-containing protein [Armatimonadota bacterium]